MPQRWRTLLALVAFTPMLMADSCHHPSVNASVDLTHLERYQSNFGVFDSPQFGLGDILDLRTDALTGGRIYTITPAQGDSTVGPLIDSTGIASSVEMNVTLDAQVPAATATAVDAAVKAYSASHTAFELKGFRRINLTDPVMRLNLTPAKVADLRTRLATSGPHLYMLVASVVVADHAELRIVDSTGAVASAVLLHAGDYDVNVTYNHNAKLTQAAHQGPVFYKVLQLDTGPHGDLIAKAAVTDLSKYSFPNAIVIR